MESYLIGDLEILLRIIAALIAGGIIGFERERKGKSAGFVTNVLVCVGAASIAVIQCLIIRDILLFDSQSTMRSDPSRLIAQIVSGVGFLGAGAILHEKGSIKGITTAATIWVVAAIGMAFGMGYYFHILWCNDRFQNYSNLLHGSGFMDTGGRSYLLV